MHPVALFLLAASGPPIAQPRTDALVARARALTGADPCRGAADEVLVCARDAVRDTRRFRLPLPAPRDSTPRGVGPLAVADAVRAADPCGLFAGQRRCAKAEARGFGLGGGRDPVTLLARLGGALLDPDADTGAAPALPEGLVVPR